MTAAEQVFVMGQLARLESEGRIEVIRERNANYHIFTFIDGRRPSDELITASLEAAGGQALSDDSKSEKAAHHATKPAVKTATRKAERKQKTTQKRARTTGRRRR